MALVKPIAQSISAFDATQDKTFSFTFTHKRNKTYSNMDKRKLTKGNLYKHNATILSYISCKKR